MLSSSQERATPALLSSGRIRLGVDRFLVFVRFFPRKFAALSRPPKRIIQERNNVTTVKVTGTRQKNATFTKFIEIVECLCSWISVFYYSSAPPRIDVVDAGECRDQQFCEIYSYVPAVVYTKFLQAGPLRLSRARTRGPPRANPTCSYVGICVQSIFPKDTTTRSQHRWELNPGISNLSITK